MHHSIKLMIVFKNFAYSIYSFVFIADTLFLIRYILSLSPFGIAFLSKLFVLNISTTILVKIIALFLIMSPTSAFCLDSFLSF